MYEIHGVLLSLIINLICGFEMIRGKMLLIIAIFNQIPWFFKILNWNATFFIWFELDWSFLALFIFFLCAASFLGFFFVLSYILTWGIYFGLDNGTWLCNLQVLTNGIEVKLQRNALSVIEAPTGNEEDDDLEFEHMPWNGSDMGEFR